MTRIVESSTRPAVVATDASQVGVTELPTRPNGRDNGQDHGQDHGQHNISRIDSKLLIPGRGSPITNGTLIWRRKSDDRPGTILFAGHQNAIPSDFRDITTTATVPTLMPGLWDCHVHYSGLPSLNISEWATLPPALAGFRAARDVAATLNAGFTSVREVGGYGIDFGLAIDQGYLPGPHIYGAGAPISQTAGHGDLHDVPLEQMHRCTAGVGVPLMLADGVDGAILAVRKMIRRGARVIKICSTGGVLSRIDSPLAAQFNRSELEAMVEEATRAGLQVASHAHGTAGILAALHAGVKTIEHGSYLTDEAIALMLEKKAILCATRLIQVAGLEVGKDIIPPVSYEKMQATVKANEKSYKAAIRAGVKCALGTDLAVSSAAVPQLSHGVNGREFVFAVEAGMTPLQAIEAGTANGPDTLGPPPSPEYPLTPAPLSGQLKDGYDADFIAVDGNPLDDIGLLADVSKITHVWKDGVLYKSPGRPVSII